MSNEATIRTSLAIRKTNTDGSIVMIEYSGKPTSFKADVTGTKGPKPGAITVATDGTNINFSELTQPGLARIANQDDTNFIEVGIYDPETYTFYPLLEFLPGESYVLRFSRNIAWEYGTGTSQTGPETNTVQARSHNQTAELLVEAFES